MKRNGFIFGSLSRASCISLITVIRRPGLVVGFPKKERVGSKTYKLAAGINVVVGIKGFQGCNTGITRITKVADGLTAYMELPNY
jgi:hypothetical protein